MDKAERLKPWGRSAPFFTTYLMHMNVYQSLYNLVNTYIYGGVANSADATELCCVLIASIGSVAMVAIPFVLCYKIITKLGGLL